MSKIYKDKVSDQLRQVIHAGFKDHAIENCGSSELGEQISFDIRSPEGETIAAITVQVFWGSLHIRNLWTHKNHRNKGYASELMQEAFAFARDNNCLFVFVETMSFQAPDFYKKHGFETEFVRNGHSKGTSFHYMKKVF